MKYNTKTVLMLLFSLVSIGGHSTNDPSKSIINSLKWGHHFQRTTVYYPFPFGDLSRKPVYDPIETDPVRIRETVRNSIYYDEYQHSPKYYNNLLLPNKVKVRAVGEQKYEVHAEVAVPDSIGNVLFCLADTGKTKCYDQLEMTLLGVESNMAYLLLKDKSREADYSYIDQKQLLPNNEGDGRNKKEAPVLKYWLPRDMTAQVDPMGMQNINRSIVQHFHFTIPLVNPSDDEYRYNSSTRIKSVVRNVKGDILDFDPFSEELPDYLYYRQKNEPNLTIDDIYRELVQRFPNDKDDNRQHPFDIVCLHATGQIGQVELTILSNSTKRLNIELEQQPYTTFSPISYIKHQQVVYIPSELHNETAETLPQRLKVMPYSQTSTNESMRIVAFLPVSFNAQQPTSQLFEFKNLKMTDSTGNSVNIEEVKSSKYRDYSKAFEESYFDLMTYSTSIAIADIPITPQTNGTLTGEIAYRYPNFKAVRYDLSKPTDLFRCEEKKIIITMPLHDFDLLDGIIRVYDGVIRVYDKEGKPVSYKDYQSKEGDLVLECNSPATYFTIMTKDNIIEGVIPFSMPVRPLK